MTAVTPRVCVGIPLLNEIRRVEAALWAIRAQTFTDLDLVISDNASTDGTGAVCQRLAAEDPRIRLFTQPATIPALENFRFVLEQARSEYFLWASGNDRVDPTFVEKTVALLDSRPDIQACTAHVVYVRGDGSRAYYSRLGYGGRPTRLEDLRDLLLNINDNSIMYGVHRRERLLECIPERTYYACDWTVAARALQLGLHAELPEVLLQREVARTDYLHWVERYHTGELERTLPLWPFTRDVAAAYGWSKLLRPGMVGPLARVHLLHAAKLADGRGAPWGRAVLEWLEPDRHLHGPSRTGHRWLTEEEVRRVAVSEWAHLRVQAQELAALKRSWSWRLTEPLRRAGAAAQELQEGLAETVGVTGARAAHQVVDVARRALSVLRRRS
jgi:hypothetical protein